MLIEFDDSCMEIFYSNSKYKSFFNKVAYEVYEEKNYYYFSKKMLEFLFKNEILDEEPKETYKRLFERSFEDNLIKQTVNRKLKIVANVEFPEEIKFCTNEYIMTLDKLIEIGLPDKINLIAENYSDCKFYRYIGKAYRTKENIKSVKLEIESIHAGGSSIYVTYNSKITEKKIAVLFVDTDRKYKNDNCGETLRKLLSEEHKLKVNKLFNDYVEIKILDVHEVENLIPISMIKNAFHNKNVLTQKKKTIDFLETCMLKDEQQREVLNFFDFKNGIEISKLSNGLYKNYWKVALENVGEKLDENDLLKGIKRDLLNEILGYLENNIEKEKFWEENIDEYLDSKWNELGKLIYSYGCTRERNVC